MTAADFFARWRVRLGYLLAVIVLFARASHVPFHSPRCRRWLRRPHHSRLRRRLSSQAGSPHRHGSLRPHPQSSVPRQLSPHPRRSHRHAFLDRRRLAPALLRPGLHLRHAPRRKRTPHKTRPCLRLLRRLCAPLFSKPYSPTSARLIRRPFLLVPIQKKSRTPSRLGLPPPPSPANSHLAHPHRLVCFCSGRPSGRFLGCFSFARFFRRLSFRGRSFSSDINITSKAWASAPEDFAICLFGCPHAAVACGVLRFFSWGCRDGLPRTSANSYSWRNLSALEIPKIARNQSACHPERSEESAFNLQSSTSFHPHRSLPALRITGN